MRSLIPILILVSTISQAQTLYLSYQPADHGVGVRYDQPVKRAGIYGSFSYGDWGLYRHYEIRDHVKASAGVLVPFNDQGWWQPYFAGAVNYHWASKEMRYPLSFELGLTLEFPTWGIAFRTDILRWEPCIDIGIAL